LHLLKYPAEKGSIRVLDVWPIVHAERKSLADDLATLSPDQWATPSLCDGWDIHDVLVHLVATAKMTRLRFIALFARAGFNFDAFVADQVNAERAADPATTLAAFRSALTSTATPPAPKITRIIEAFLHGEDIRRPLGIAHEYPIEHIGPAVEYFARDRLSGGMARLDGLTLSATDTDFSIGSGPAVEGPAMSLLLAASGRKIVLAELSGPGIGTLGERD
jgi:uncharacterized protein (TIGR03083 family)